MAAQPTEAQIAHQELIDTLDIHAIHKSFRNPHWKPNQRRNKNIKAILGDALRREAASASVAATPMDNNSGAATPMDIDGGNNNAGDDKNNGGLSTSGPSTPVSGATAPPNLAQASRSLSKLVLEKSLKQNSGGAPGAGAAAGGSQAPSATYTNIESAPSLAHTKRYCDITGLPAPYLDPKSRLRYHNREVFGFIRTLPQGVGEQYLEARGAHTVLK